MENFWKRHKDSLILFAIMICIICLIALVFFRTSILLHAGRSLASILTPFIYGFVIAYLLRPVSLFLEKILSRLAGSPSEKKNGWIRTVCIILSLVLFLTVLAALLLLVLPQIISSISSLISRMPGAISQFQTWLNGLDTGDEASHEAVAAINEIIDTIYRRVQSFLQTSLLPTLQTTVSRVTSSFMGILNVVKNFGLGCIISVYFLGNWEKFGMQAKMLVFSLFPRKGAEWIREEVHFIDRKFNGFIIGKLVDSAIIGVICFLFTRIFSFPYAVLVSVIVGVTNIIPFFGPYLGMIPSVLLMLTEDIPKALIFLVFIMILQQIDGNVIGPKILGDQLGISSFWILFSILFFGAVWGLMGMLVGAPLFAVLYDLIRRWIRNGLKRRDCLALEEEYRKKYPD